MPIYIIIIIYFIFHVSFFFLYTFLKWLNVFFSLDKDDDFKSSDNQWLSNLENTNWLQSVSQCMSVANHVMSNLHRESVTVVLKGNSINFFQFDLYFNLLMFIYVDN